MLLVNIDHSQDLAEQSSDIGIGPITVLEGILACKEAWRVPDGNTITLPDTAG